VLSNDLASEDAWPTFTTAATAHGYAAVLSTAVLSGPEPVPFTGALNIYSRHRDRFDDSARDLAFLLATHASLALAMAHTRQALAQTENIVANLRHALDSRTIIGQATGILMARRKITANQAFNVLKRTSQNHNVKLAELAMLLTEEPDITAHL
jgi:GAF domain-containing protein